MLGELRESRVLAVIHFLQQRQMLRDLRQCQMTGIQHRRQFFHQCQTQAKRRILHAAVRPCLKLHARKKFLHQSFTKLLLMGLWKAGIIALRQIH